MPVLVPVTTAISIAVGYVIPPHRRNTPRDGGGTGKPASSAVARPALGSLLDEHEVDDVALHRDARGLLDEQLRQVNLDPIHDDPIVPLRPRAQPVGQVLAAGLQAVDGAAAGLL